MEVVLFSVWWLPFFGMLAANRIVLGKALATRSAMHSASVVLRYSTIQVGECCETQGNVLSIM